jgi:hypothetical protein
LDLRPHIVHFAGHGQGKHGLVFEDEAGLPKLISGEALAELFRLFADRLRCVLLNGCYAEHQARPIAQHIHRVIGTSGKLSDDAATVFSAGFYDALGAGHDIDFAYEYACNAIAIEGLSEEMQPILFRREPIEGPPRDDEPLPPESEGPLEVFISHSSTDDGLLEGLMRHLSILRRSGLINIWHSKNIPAGDPRAGKIDEKIDAADLILLLISPGFLASDECYDHQLRRALERHEAGHTRVIPVILRPGEYSDTPFIKLQGLPRNSRPVTSWSDQDLVLAEITKEIRQVCQDLRQERSSSR